MFSGTALVRQHKYTALLIVLLAMLVLQSFYITTGSERIGRDVTATVFGVAIFLVVFERSALQTVMAVFLFIAISTGWAFHTHVSSLFDRALAVTQAVALAIFYWVVVWAILRNLFRTPVIGADNVFGAICGYLIAGQGWAYLNALTYLIAPTTYLFDPKVVPPLADWHGRTALFAYYSYSQMLTIGYAAVTPLNAPATTLSLVAALFGLFYTAVIVSQLVGMAQTNRKDAYGKERGI
jgi:voltage-gated potassium channel